MLLLLLVIRVANKMMIYLFIYLKLSDITLRIKNMINMAEHWTLQDTSIITDATLKQRTRLINNL